VKIDRISQYKDAPPEKETRTEKNENGVNDEGSMEDIPAAFRSFPSGR